MRIQDCNFAPMRVLSIYLKHPVFGGNESQGLQSAENQLYSMRLTVCMPETRDTRWFSAETPVLHFRPDLRSSFSLVSLFSQASSETPFLILKLDCQAHLISEIQLEIPHRRQFSRIWKTKVFEGQIPGKY